MFIPKHLKGRLFPVLVNRAVIFFFIMSLMTFFLYIIGTIQGFVDSTQLLLLRLLVILALCLIVSSVFGLVLNVMRFSKQKKLRYLIRAGCYFLLILFGVITALIILFIFTLSTGNGAV